MATCLVAAEHSEAALGFEYFHDNLLGYRSRVQFDTT